MPAKILSNQIAKIQTNTKLIGFYDKLQKASPEHYAQIHVKGEKDSTGFNRNSLIGIMIFDYTNGTGDNNVVTQFNLTPEQIQFLLSRVTCGMQDFEWSSSKIFGKPDASGMSIAQAIQISRHGYKQDGTISKNPWFISISNGKGVKVQNKMGGSYMKGGSYVQEKYGFINLCDMDMYFLLKRADSFINAFQELLVKAFDNQISYNAVKEIYDSLAEKKIDMEISGNEVSLTEKELSDIIISKGKLKEHEDEIREFAEEYAGCQFSIENIVSDTVSIKADSAIIKADLVDMYTIEKRVIDGREYFLVPARNSSVDGLSLISE